MEGYIKLYRKLLGSRVFADPIALKIWIWCILKASRKERFISLKVGKGSRIVKILPGQIIFGRLKAESELNISGSTIYRWIQNFKSDEWKLISIEVDSQYSIISICNWEHYQNEKPEVEQPTDRQRTANELATDTDKTVNKVKNKKGTVTKFSVPKIEEIQAFCLEEKINIKADVFFYHYQSNGWMMGKVKMKDWRAALRKWEKSEYYQSGSIKLLKPETQPSINTEWQ